MASQAQLSLVAPAQQPRRKPHNTNRGRKFPPEPITTDEFAKLLAAECLALYEHDLRPNERAIVVRHGKGDKRRIVMVDEWGWREIEFWLTVRVEIAPGALLPTIRGKGAGREMQAPDVRRQMAILRERAGLRRRVHPHAFRHGFAVDSSREGIPLYSLQGQLGHARLDVTERYLRGIDPMERLAPFGARRAPTTTIPSITHAAARPSSSPMR